MTWRPHAALVRALTGRVDEQVITSELLHGNPLGDPYERPLWVYLPPGYDDEPDRRYPSVYVIQGYTGHLRCGATAAPFRQPFPETADADLRARRGAAGDRRLRRRLDRLRRQPVRRLTRHRPLPLLPVRRGGALGGRPLPDGCRAGPAGDHGQVQRRLRRDDHADAASRPVRRARHPCRRLALRAELRFRVRQGRPVPARLRRRHLALVDGLQVADLVHQGSRP